MVKINKNKQAYREVLGEKLREFREGKGYSLYRVAKDGDMSIQQVQSVESGDANYTIDSFLGYLAATDLYVFFADKSEDRQLPHDYDDISRKAVENDPERK